MKTGVSMFSFTEDADLKRIFPLIKKAGYDGVEPVFSEKGYLDEGTVPEKIDEIRKIAAEEGLEIPSVGVWSLWKYNLVSEHASVRRRAEDIVKRQIEAAKRLGAETVLVVPGYVGCDFVEKPERIRYDRAYERCVEAFKTLGSFGKQEGVDIGIENVWNRFLLSPLEMKRMLEEIGLPSVGAYFDVGNIMNIGYPEDWIEILGTHILKIHLSDYRTSQSGMGGFVDLFAGDVDFLKVAESLGGIGYDGWITLEMLPNYRQFPEVSIFSNRPAVEKIAKLIETDLGRRRQNIER